MCELQDVCVVMLLFLFLILFLTYDKRNFHGYFITTGQILLVWRFSWRNILSSTCSLGDSVGMHWSIPYYALYFTDSLLSFLFVMWVRMTLLSGQPSSAVEVTQSHRLTEGKTRVWIIGLNTIKGISLDRMENQREKSKVSPLLVSPYYTTLDCAQTHYLVRTDPTLRRPLINSGCMYASYFTSMVTPEVKVEWSRVLT